MKIRCGAFLAAAVAAFSAARVACAADGVPLPGLPGAEVSFRIIAEEFGSSNRAMKVAAPSNMKAMDVKVGKDGKTVVTWRGSESFGADFTVTAVFEALPDGSVGWTFGYEKCECPLPVAEVRFPIVTVPRGPETAILYPASIGALVWPEWAKCRPGATVASARPQTFHFIAALTEGGTGWYLDQRDDARFYTGMFNAKAGQKAGTVSLEAVCEPPAASPRDWRMPFGGTIAALPGADWFAAAARYRDWARRQPWYRAARTRDFGKMRDIAMWFWNRGAAEHVITPVERFQKASGVPAALDWYWWHDIPYDTGFPNFWPPREGEEVFRAAVKRCNDAGIFIQVYTNGMTWDLDDPSWTEGGEEGVRISKDGTFRATAFNRFLPHRLAYMCGTAEKYQTRMRKLYRTLASTGMPGIYMDMIGNASYAPCYSTNHVHAPGGGTHGIKGYRKFAAQVKADNPGILLCTEDATEPYLDVFDAGICLACNSERFGSNDDRRYAVPVNQAVYHGCEVLFGSYAMVHGTPPFDPKWPTDRKWKVEKDWKAMFPDQFALELVRGVTWGMQPMVHNFRPGDDTDPRFTDDYRLMIDTARFYHGNRDFLFDGDMCAPGKMECDTQKIDFLVRGTYAREGEYRTITRNTIPAVLHSVWRAPDGRTAAVLVNWTRAPRKYALSAPDISAKGEIPPRSWRLVPAAKCADAMSAKYREVWNDEVQAQIDARIEKCRKADAAVDVDAPDGAEVKVEQVSHAFQFGSHIFNFDQLGRDDWNDVYKATFTNLWNAATIAFYWNAYEPVQGAFRFAPGPHDGAAFWNAYSSLTPAEKYARFPEYRRPAPDPIVDFCERNGIAMHGHVMVYRSYHPQWVEGDDPKSPAVIAKYEAHIRELARHYGRRIGQWDVVNESCRRDASPSAPDDAEFWGQPAKYPVPADYTLSCFKAAEKYLDPSVKAVINEACTIDEVYLAFVKSLIERGAKIDVVGIQYHIFSANEMRDLARGEHKGRRGYCYTPERIMKTLADADRLGRPIHISEITIPAPEDTAWGHEVQAQALRDLYRLWFSWPSVYRITYWNLVDYTYHKESLSSGFYAKDMKKKPVWYMMDDLLNREWKTRLTVKADGGKVAFRGFKGRYRLTWKGKDGKEHVRSTEVK